MKRFHFLPLIMGVALTLSACHDNNDEPEALKAGSFSSRDNLSLTFNGTQMAGKRVTVTPAESGGDAMLTFDAAFELSQLGEVFKDLPPIPAPGVLPGSPKLTVSTPMYPDGDFFTFSGSNETEFVTYRYAGKVNNTECHVDFTDVTLKNPTYAGGAWKPAPAEGLPTADTQPFHIVWETQMPIPLPGLEYQVQDLLRILVNAPLIPAYNNTAYMSLTQVIANGLRSLAMNADGNMPVTYLQTANGASIFTLAPKCMFQYVPLNDYSIKLYVNPTDLLSLILLNNTNRDPNIPDNPFGKSTRADASLLDLLKALVSKTAPMLADGIPMAAVRQNDTMQLYLSSEVLLPLLKQGIIPLLQNPAVRGIVLDYVNSHDELSQHAVAIMALYDALPLILDQTSKIEFGLNLVKA